MTDTRSMTLNGIKREKNLTAVLDKDYPRFPNEVYPIANKLDPPSSLWGHVNREMTELRVVLQHLVKDVVDFGEDVTWNEASHVLWHIKQAKEEIGDVSNTLDYLFDNLDLLEREWRDPFLPQLEEIKT